MILFETERKNIHPGLKQASFKHHLLLHLQFVIKYGTIVAETVVGGNFA
jgi:hypothetical protein